MQEYLFEEKLSKRKRGNGDAFVIINSIKDTKGGMIRKRPSK